jgi:hypothetical protein
MLRPLKTKRNSGLTPIALASTYGFKAHELNELERMIREHQIEYLEAWREHLD